MEQVPGKDVQDGPAGSPYRYSSRRGYAEAYGYDSPEAYDQARAEVIAQGGGDGHHPGLCSSRCPSCKEPQHHDGPEPEPGAG